MTAIQFLRECSTGKYRIVSSGDLDRFQISQAQACNRFYVDEETAYGWALLPWECTTDKDRQREREYFQKHGSSTVKSNG